MNRSFPSILLIDMELGHAYAVAGRRNDALNRLQDLSELAKSRYVPALYLASIYEGLGDKSEALSWLEKAAQERPDGLAFLRVDPESDSLRSDPRFQDLLRRMGLPS